jgi:hypothetical protein
VIGGDIQLSSLSSRTALARRDGGARSVQGFHRDWPDRGGADGRFAVCNSMWMIDDFTAEGGSTRAPDALARPGPIASCRLIS